MPFSAPTVTMISAAGQTVYQIMQNLRDSRGGQTTGMQNLGTLQDSAGQLATAIYDVSANIIYVQAL